MNEKTVDTVTLYLWRYQELLKAERQLNALENAGVDNWDGYAEALGDDEQL
jgi:hypothetical protein